MNFDKKEMVLVSLIILMFLSSFYLYPIIRERIPTHWDLSGQADRYGSKLMGLFLLPVITVFMYLILYIIPKIEVYKKNIQSFSKYYFYLKLILILFMTSLYIGTIIQVFRPFNISYLMIPSLAILFFIIGWIMPHTKRNFFVGIRTPWTLSSDKVWKETHEKGGKLFQITALIILIGILFPRYILWFLLIPLLGIIVFVIFYSYFLYQKEEKRKFKKKK